jgi:hypothetical protein
METAKAAIHRKLRPSHSPAPISGFAHKAGIVGDADLAAVLASFDMTAEHGSAADLDGRHDAAMRTGQSVALGSAE